MSDGDLREIYRRLNALESQVAKHIAECKLIRERHEVVKANVEALMAESWQQKGAWRSMRRWMLVISLAGAVGGLVASIVNFVNL